MENKNGGIYVVVTLLCVAVLVMGGYLIYDKVLSKNNANSSSNGDSNSSSINNNANTTEENNDFVTPSTYTTKIKNEVYTVDVDETKYNNVFEYVGKQNNVSIKVNYCGKSTDATHPPEQTEFYTLSDSEVSTVLSEMKLSTQNTAGGLGGICVPVVLITYTRKGIEHKLDLYYVYAINSTTDGNIYKIYDKNVTGVENYTYGFKNLSPTLEHIIAGLIS